MSVRRACGAIIRRELVRMLRQKGRLVSAMVRPLIWLLVIGAGFDSLLAESDPGAYRQFMVPGLLCMVLLFGAMLASLSLVYDKESGVMRMLIVAPFPRYWIVLARVLSAAIAGLVQVAILIPILAVLGYLTAPSNIGLALLGLVATSLTCASLGMLIAVFSKTLENYAVIMNFVVFPMFFLSGALYPLHDLPAFLKTVALFNPFSYGVDVMKHAMAAGTPAGFGADFNVLTDLVAMAIFIGAALTIASLRFSNSGLMEVWARRLAGGRRR